MPLTIIARQQERQSRTIDELSDLPGKRVNLGPAGSSERAGIEIFLAELGWDQTDFALVGALPPTAQAAALCDGEVDALVLMTAHPSRLVAEIAEQCPIRLIGGQDDTIAAVRAGHPYYAAATIPAPLYRLGDGSVASLGVSAVLIARADLQAAAAQGVFSAIEAQDTMLRQAHPVLADWHALSNPMEAASAPPHQALRAQPTAALKN